MAEPTKEKMIEFFKEQIEIKEWQVKLQSLNTTLAKERAEELKALSVIAQITNPNPNENAVPHTVTQEDLDNNPELKEAGVAVGDEILIPKEAAPAPARSLKKDEV